MRGGRRVRAYPCGKRQTIEAMSSVILRRDKASWLRCPRSVPRTCVGTDVAHTVKLEGLSVLHGDNGGDTVWSCLAAAHVDTQVDGPTN
jgi:aconitase A